MKGEVIGGVGLHMSADDNVITAIDGLSAEASIPYEGREIELTGDVPFGHKIALVRIEAGDRIVKYGETIGRASQAIESGEWIHTHNCESTRGRGDLAASEGNET